ncbi:protein hemingway [Drosophila tropicalis]|uniref:protein hemingway n=1 Tax=Drosophila tropicalis TaxID=46794 RepID=UPI0035AC14F9
MMSEVPVNSDDEYVDESFEEDSQSEVEEEQEIEISEDNYDVANQMQLEHLEDEQEEEDDEYSDTQSESDAEAEFMRGNPHARRQQLYSGRSTGGFNHTRMPTYPSSSSDDESSVVVTKTVAEVNELVGVLSIHEEDEALSVRTLKPSSAHNKTVREEQREADASEVEEIEEEEEVIQSHAANNNDIDDDAESIDEEEEEDEIQIEESEDDQKTEADDHEYNDMGDQDQEQYFDDDDGGCEEEEVIQMNMQDMVTVVDASDNSSDQSGPVSRMHNTLDNVSLYSAETEYTVVQERTPRKPSGIPKPVSLNSSRSARQRAEVNVEPPIENVQPQVTYQQTDLDFTVEKEVVEISPPPQLEDFVNDSSMKPDAAAVKYLEQKMTQMSEMIMNSFRMSGGAVNNPALEQLAKATGMMQSHAARLGTVDECDGISTTGSSAPISSRSCGDRRRPTPQHHHLDSQNTLAGTVRSARLARPSCRCPSATDSLAGMAELQPEMELGMDEFLMDECGQGDGLMRHHPHRRRQQQNVNCGFSSATPSTTYSSSGAGKTAPGALRPRSSTDKVNNKNAGRKSFSFSNYQVREIERQNHILLKKMMSIKPTAAIKASTSSIKCNPNAPPKQTPPVARLSSAAVNRKKGQRQIDLDNDLLKRKLEAIGARRPQFK